MMPSLKQIAKRSKLLHSAFKFARDRRALPPGRWREWRKVATVFRVLPNTMLPMPRLFDAYDAVLEVDRLAVPGDIVECGVWNGGCVGLMATAHLRTRSAPRRRIHLFDSFEGLPQPSDEDTDIAPGFRRERPDLDVRVAGDEGLVAIGACVGENQPAVEAFLTKTLGLPRALFDFHVGWFQDTVPQATEIGQIAVLRLDGDWYDSTRVCIQSFYDRVAPGGFIIIDDYGAFSGCRQAIDAFFASVGTIPQFIRSDAECVYFRKA